MDPTGSEKPTDLRGSVRQLVSDGELMAPVAAWESAEPTGPAEDQPKRPVM